MNVLIIHDRQAVADSIANLLKDCVDLHLEIAYAEDGISARGFLQDRLFDLVVIDLTIPHIKGRSEVTLRTASDLLDELFVAGTLVIPGDIIGISKEATALTALDASLGSHLMTLVEEDDGGNWKKILTDKLRYCAMASRSRHLSILSQYDYDALVITALDEELAPLLEIFEHSPVSAYFGANEFSFRDKLGGMRRGVLFAVGKSGQASAASSVQSLITFFRPKLAVMSGFCGGIKGKAEKGDIVYFKSSYDWDYGKWYQFQETADGGAKASTFAARPEPVSIRNRHIDAAVRALVADRFQSDGSFTKRLEAVAGNLITDFEVHYSAAASGSAVVGSSDIVDQIRSINDGIKAIDMESYGFYYACETSRAAAPAYLCVKAVADWADAEKDDRYHAVCSWLAAQSVSALLTRQWEFT